MLDDIPVGVDRRAGRREWVGLAVLALPTVLVALDLSVLFLALPRLSADLGAGATQQLWVMDIYGFMTAGFLVTMGTLGDRIGRRRLLMIGAAAFAGASVLAAYSRNVEMLIVARALLGVAGATLAPSSLALISNMFPAPRQRATAIAVWMSCFMGGAALGPVVGGALLELFWWGSVFLLGVPVMVLLLATAPLLLPEYRDPGAGRLDLTSVALSLASILPVIYGIKEFARGELTTVPVLAVVVGAAVGVVFVRRQRRLSSPLLDLRLFGNRAFSAALVILMFGVAAQGGVMLLVTQYLQLVDGLAPLRAGLWLVPGSLAMVAGSMAAPLSAQRVRPGIVIAAGMATSAVGYLLLTQVDAVGGLSLLVTGSVLVFFGVGVMGVLSNDLVVGSVPPEKAGSAASMSQTSGDFGIALGIAVFGSVGTAVYRHQIADDIPAGVPAPAAAAIRDTLAAAAAQPLPGELGVAVLDSARTAFTSGLNVASALGGVVVAGLAVLAIVALRRVPPSGRAHDDGPAPGAAEVSDDAKHPGRPPAHTTP
jgi:MFS transporter, DHA2 family, multidrug resistance protein